MKDFNLLNIIFVFIELSQMVGVGICAAQKLWPSVICLCVGVVVVVNQHNIATRNLLAAERNTETQ